MRAGDDTLAHTVKIEGHVYDVKQVKDRIHALAGMHKPSNVRGRRMLCSTADAQYIAQSDNQILKDIQQQTDTEIQVCKEQYIVVALEMRRYFHRQLSVIAATALHDITLKLRWMWFLKHLCMALSTTLAD
jgi:hypothetical protein